MSLKKNTHLIRTKALELGFESIGISKAKALTNEGAKLEHWLSKNYHGEMGYMANHFDKRIDPTKLVPGSKSVISLIYNYHTKHKIEDPSAPKISQYAQGQDYHYVIKYKLKEILKTIRAEIGAVEGRVFVDSAPILERAWAERSGLGWNGKNTLLIHPNRGSYYFLGEIILDLELDYDHPLKDYCGTCRKCIDACPTEAISPQGYLVDGSKCISYLTIELREAIPSEFKGKMENWMFGCDICQDVCPWNKFAKQHKEPLFEAPEKRLAMTKKDWQNLEEKTFNNVFKKSPVKRTRFLGLKRNIDFLDKER